MGPISTTYGKDTIISTACCKQEAHFSCAQKAHAANPNCFLCRSPDFFKPYIIESESESSDGFDLDPSSEEEEEEEEVEEFPFRVRERNHMILQMIQEDQQARRELAQRGNAQFQLERREEIRIERQREREREQERQRPEAEQLQREQRSERWERHQALQASRRAPTEGRGGQRAISLNEQQMLRHMNRRDREERRLQVQQEHQEYLRLRDERQEEERRRRAEWEQHAQQRIRESEAEDRERRRFTMTEAQIEIQEQREEQERARRMRRDDREYLSQHYDSQTEQLFAQHQSHQEQLERRLARQEAHRQQRDQSRPIDRRNRYAPDLDQNFFRLMSFILSGVIEEEDSSIDRDMEQDLVMDYFKRRFNEALQCGIISQEQFDGVMSVIDEE
tara:strand:- start:318 stop:1490 length:1173 start_codon:yes stop_codon:yes gene_type:complete